MHQFLRIIKKKKIILDYYRAPVVVLHVSFNILNRVSGIEYNLVRI